MILAGKSCASVDEPVRGWFNFTATRYKIQRGDAANNPEIAQKLVETRDRLYWNLERQGEDESEMGDLQKLDHLESHNVGIEDLRKRREALEKLQCEIENHPLFIKRDTDSRSS